MAQSTGTLKAVSDATIPMNRIIVNPNDGFDLGLMNTAHPVKLHGTVVGRDGATQNGYLMDGQLLQENNCTLGTVVIATKLYTQLGKPTTVKLSREDSQLTIKKA